MDEEFERGRRVRIDGYGYSVEDVRRGGMGLVILCTSIRDNSSVVYQRRLACKVFEPGSDQAQILSELAVWKQLLHPHIATLKAIGYVNDYLCAVMRWFEDGAVTSQYVWASGGLEVIKRLLQQMARALEHAWSSGILHLDIKPANILCDHGGFMLADWGIAKTATRRAIAMHPSSGGTLPYMAPERFMNEPNDIAADLYSLGITTFELLTASLPFVDLTREAMKRDILLGTVSARVQTTSQKMPQGWQIFLRKCCAKNPRDRPRSYAKLLELIDALET